MAELAHARPQMRLVQQMEQQGEPLPVRDLASVRNGMAGELDQKDLDEFDCLMGTHDNLLASLQVLYFGPPHEKGGAAPSPTRKRKPRGDSGDRTSKRRKGPQVEKTTAESADEPERRHSEGPNIDEHQAEAGRSLHHTRSPIRRNRRGASGAGEESEGSALPPPSLGLLRHKEKPKADTDDVVDVDPRHAVPLLPAAPHSAAPSQEPPIARPPTARSPTARHPTARSPIAQPPIAQPPIARPPQLPAVPVPQPPSLSDYCSALKLAAGDVQKATQAMSQKYMATITTYLALIEGIIQGVDNHYVEFWVLLVRFPSSLPDGHLVLLHYLCVFEDDCCTSYELAQQWVTWRFVTPAMENFLLAAGVASCRVQEVPGDDNPILFLAVPVDKGVIAPMSLFAAPLSSGGNQEQI
ncbi:hypothetical protein BS47DRAFT_1361252 [Hydnum rufescens UP504]|uniref:Uncharacterized protein n=1 Tax=Hydnum rufescens UP504 TaxID=1448309 RepID=A0A9P6B1A7_9AGAM|nr:hypothetical protein BS47DRAFT_1361252 [Hydnum rufescens UP504]